MNTFIKIMQNEIGFSFIPPSKNYLNIYFKYPFFKDRHKLNVHFYVHYYIHILYNNIFITTYRDFNSSKLIALFEILENKFINHEIKDAFFTIFCKSQKAYFGFSKLAKMWRYKKAEIKNKEDLSMNPIEENEKSVKIYQNSSFFLFRVSELINILETSIVNNEHFFAKPLPIKNPYNNTIFNLSTLYYIYYSIKSSSFIMPNVIQYYFLCDFDKNRLLEEHEFDIRELSIKNAVYKSNIDTLYKSIIQMLRNNSYSNLLTIHPEFPKKELINIFSPFLLIYYRYLYSMIEKDERYGLLDNLNFKLKYFYLNNPHFGRKHIKTIKTICPTTFEYIIKREVTFNMDTSKYNDYF